MYATWNSPVFPPLASSAVSMSQYTATDVFAHSGDQSSITYDNTSDGTFDLDWDHDWELRCSFKKTSTSTGNRVFSFSTNPLSNPMRRFVGIIADQPNPPSISISIAARLTIRRAQQIEASSQKHVCRFSTAAVSQLVFRGYVSVIFSPSLLR